MPDSDTEIAMLAAGLDPRAVAGTAAARAAKIKQAFRAA